MSRLAIIGASVALLSSTAATARAVDYDGDGAADPADVAPCDPNVAAEAFFPSAGAPGSILFEDQWPRAGDLDFNDVVLGVHLTLRLHASGGATGLRLVLTPVALGGIFDNGLGLALPVPRSSVSGVTLAVGGGSASALSPSAADSTFAVRIAGDLRALFGGTAGQINSLTTVPRRTGLEAVLEVHFTAPIALSLADAPFDLFIFRTDRPSLEIHRTAYAGTAAMDQTLFGSADDGSSAARHFVDRTGLPFALVFPAAVDYPKEATPISALYPRIVLFAQSAGQSAQDFYTSGAVPLHAYADSLGQPAPDPKLIPPPTAACFPRGQCPGTFVYHFSGYGGGHQYNVTFRGRSGDTHHIAPLAGDAECLGYGIPSINAIWDQNNNLVNGEYRICCNNGCGPSISRVSFTPDDPLCGTCPGTFVYHFSGYGGGQQYDVTFRGLSGDEHHIAPLAGDAECLGYGIPSINAIWNQNNQLVNGEYRVCCNNGCGPHISLVNFTADDPSCAR